MQKSITVLAKSRIDLNLRKLRKHLGESDIEPDTEAPTTPKNLTASKVTHHSVALNWEAATDNGSCERILDFP